MEAGRGSAGPRVWAEGEWKVPGPAAPGGWGERGASAGVSPGHRLREQIPWPVGSREGKAAAPQPRRSTGVASLRQQPALPGSAVAAECSRVLKALPPSRSEAPGLLDTEPGAPPCLCNGLVSQGGEVDGVNSWSRKEMVCAA